MLCYAMLLILIMMIQKQAEQRQCPICYSEYSIPATPPIILCRMKHTLCRNCVLQLYKSNRCPLCRYSLHSNEVMYNQQKMVILGEMKSGVWLQQQNALKQALLQQHLNQTKTDLHTQFAYQIRVIRVIRIICLIVLLIFALLDYLLATYNTSPTLDTPFPLQFVLIPSTTRAYLQFSYWQQLLTVIILLLQALFQRKFYPSITVNCFQIYFCISICLIFLRSLLFIILQLVMFFGLVLWEVQWLCFSYLLLFTIGNIITITYVIIQLND